MNNFGRHHLVTKFVCAKCGELLNLSYDMPKKKGCGDCADGITGASKVEAYIAIEPCSGCLNLFGILRQPSKR